MGQTVGKDYDRDKPMVSAQLSDGIIIIVARNAITGKTESVRFHPKYTRQLALDILDMADSIEDRNGTS